MEYNHPARATTGCYRLEAHPVCRQARGDLQPMSAGFRLCEKAIKFNERFLFPAAYLGYHLKALVGKGSKWGPIGEIGSSP